MGRSSYERSVSPISRENVEQNLLIFFRDIWLKPRYKYIVFIARRCFNLNEAFMRDCHARNGSVPPNIDYFMSDMGLLLQAEKLAEYYTKHKKFPKILICDDLIFYGRGLTRLLYQLEVLIAEHLDDAGSYSGYEIHRELVRAVDIYVFAANRNQIILDADYQKKVTVATRRMYPSQLRVLSHYIAEYLAKSDVPYTTYVFSAELDAPIRDDTWQRVRWTYHRHNTCVLLKGEQNCIQTIRYHTEQNETDTEQNETDDKILVTAFPMLANLNPMELHTICSGIAGLLSRQRYKYKTIRHILENGDELLQKMRGQLLTFIYSVISLYEFAPQSRFALPDSNDTDAQINDLYKIASNFGQRGKVDIEFTRLAACLTDSGHDELRTQIKNLLFNIESGRLTAFEPGEPVISEEEREAIIKAAEDIAYDADAEGEKESWQVCSNERWFYPTRRSSDMVDPEKFLQDMHEKTKLPAEQYRGAFLTGILALMDCGYLALKLEADQDSGEIQSRLKAGEPSLHIMMWRYEAVMPALQIIEKNQWRFKISKQEAIEQFLEKLPVEALPEETRKSLRELRDRRSYICSSVYDSGQTFTGWNSSLKLLEHDDEWDDRDAIIDAQELCMNFAEDFVEQTAVI